MTGAADAAAIWQAVATLQKQAPHYLTEEALALTDEAAVAQAAAAEEPAPAAAAPPAAAKEPPLAVDVTDGTVDEAALPDDDDDDTAANAAAAERAKAQGNEAFSRGEFATAVKQFDRAIRLAPKNHVLYSNRSGAHASLGNHAEALSDAERCLKLSPEWPKGFSRKGAALVLCSRYKEAMKAYQAGLALDPSNAGLLKGLADLKESIQKGNAPTAQTEGAPPAAAAAPKKKKPAAVASQSAGVASSPTSSSLPIGQQWIEAAKRGDRAAMEALLQQDESLVAYKARGIGHTALHWAATQGDKRQMEWLVSLGAEVNGRNTSDATPLHTAAGERRPPARPKRGEKITPPRPSGEGTPPRRAQTCVNRRPYALGPAARALLGHRAASQARGVRVARRRQWAGHVRRMVATPWRRRHARQRRRPHARRHRQQ